MSIAPEVTDTATKYSIEFHLPYVETDPNNILGRAWRAKHQRFLKIKNDIKLITHSKKPGAPLEKFKISITRSHGGRFLDWDNLIASFKPIIDGLTMAGIIKNDSWKYIRHIEADQVKSKEGEQHRLIIKVEEV